MKRDPAADLFCGSGCSSEGIEQAAAQMGRSLDICGINHNVLAVQSYRMNHPTHRVVNRTLEDRAPKELTPTGHLLYLHASPECIHHSKARGGAPMLDQSRSTAWVIPHLCSHVHVDFLSVENVRDFLSWGPLDPTTRRPIKELKGTIFKTWLAAIEAYGFVTRWGILDAADYGDPTHRERFFLVAGRGQAPELPKATHGPGKLPYATIRPCLNLDDLGESVRVKWRTGRLRSALTMEQIRIGLEKFGGDPFILRRRQHDNSLESDVRSVDQPLHTITANATDIALLIPRGRTVYHRMLRVRELARAHSLPEHFQFAGNTQEQVRQIGNGVPVALQRAVTTAVLQAA